MEVHEKQIEVLSILGIVLVIVLYTIAFVLFVEMQYMMHKKVASPVDEQLLTIQKKYAEKLMHIQEEDRKRLSEELHDNVMSRFHLMRLNLYEGNIELLKKNLTMSMKIVRALSHNFASLDNDSRQLPILVEEYLFQLRNQFVIDYHISQFSKKEQLTSVIKNHVFRIFQEIFNNILKHSKATKITIQLRSTEKAFALLIKDNGCGFTINETRAGLGFKNIHLRSMLVDGVYKFKTVPKAYTVFILLIPKPKIKP